MFSDEELTRIWHVLCEALARRRIYDSDPDGCEEILALIHKLREHLDVVAVPHV